jgi:ribosome-binding protein aMBF1 (putative translation factor)
MASSNPAELKRELLKRAAKLLDVPDLARRLNVPSTVLESWMRGDATMPDGKLMDLARLLDRLSREERSAKQS